MPDFKTHLNALLESFGLDYFNFQNITLNYETNEVTSTHFIPPCDGFLIIFCGTYVASAYIVDVIWGYKNVANVNYGLSSPNWCSVNALVKKGRTYNLDVSWGSDGVGNSQALFVPFTFSRQKS